MQNINVLHECKDVWTTYDEQRRAGKLAVDLIPGDYMADETIGIDLEDALLQDDSLDAESDFGDDDVADEGDGAAVSKSPSLPDPDVQRAITLMKLRSKERSVPQPPSERYLPFSLASSDDYANIASYTEYMKSLKQSGKPQLSHCAPPPWQQMSGVVSTTANVVLDTISDFKTVDERINLPDRNLEATLPIEEIVAVEKEFGFHDNAEQSRAFWIVA